MASISQELRQAVLQAAIQGKLTKQLPEDGDANQLYDLIRKSHAPIQKYDGELDYSSMDFDIPRNWTWTKLNEIVDFVDYRGKTPHKTSSGVFLITASNIRFGFMDYTRKEYISNEEYKDRQSRGITEKGDVLFTTEAPMGNAAICDLDICSCGQRIITMKQYMNSSVYPVLLMYYILSPSFQKQLNDNATGTTAKGIKGVKLKHFIIPLPPLDEQHRIVSRIEELMAKIDELEKIENELKALHQAFPGDMKAALLQAAMQGKLTEQLPEDGNAEDLLEQIKAEKERLVKEKKIKKEKPLAPIAEDDVLFEIPENWSVARLGSVITLLSGQDMPPTGYNAVGKGTVYLTGASNLTDDGTVIVNRWTETPKAIARRGDLLLSCKGTIGKTCILNLDKVHIARQFMAISPIIVLVKYIQYYVFSYVDELRRSAKSMIPGIERENVLSAIIPIPPLTEQRRIVERLDKLLPLCDSLQTEL